MERKNTSLEDIERGLRAQLGDKYDLAIDHCYSLLQITCKMEEPSVLSNSFTCLTSGGQYRLTKYGFKFMLEQYVTQKQPKSFWQKIFGS